MNIQRKSLTVAAFLLSMSLGADAQSVKLHLDGVSVKKAMTQLRVKSGYSFVFALSDVNTSRKVNVNATELKQAVNQILQGQDVSYKIDGKNIVVSKKKEQKERGTAPQQGKTAKRVTGNVVDETGMPIIGATVRQKGTQNAVVTDMDGNFALNVPEGTELEINYIGYEPKALRVADKNSYSLAMQPESKELKEVVVTALGIKRAEKALSYNVQKVDGDQLTTNKDANFINSLNGKVAGININASSSGAGGSAKVVMRGARSIEQSSNVLYVIDGVPMFNLSGDGDTEFGSKGTTEEIADINPEDIESMSVLTGAAAAALYGNRASNGAIVITTKKGQAGKTTVTVSQTTEFSKALRTPEFQNRYGTGSSLRDAGADSYSWGKLLNDANYVGYDPVSDYLKTGREQRKTRPTCRHRR